jgi:type I restriction enzyme S subunit
MGVIAFKIKLSSIRQDDTVRIDAKFSSLINSTGYDVFDTNMEGLIPLKDILTPDYQLFYFEEGKEYFGVPTGKEYTNKFGEITSTKIVTKEDHPNRLRYKANENSILISSLKGAKTPALNFDFDLSNYVFSNGFYIFNVSENWNKDFVLFLLRTKKIKYVLDTHLYRGIGISTYKESDFLKLKIPYIDIKEQNRVIEKICPIKDELSTLKSSRIQTMDIVNQVFSSHYEINLSDVKNIEKIRLLSIPLSDVNSRNSGLRNSLRWNKMQLIQSFIYSEIDCVETLGSFIQSTNNGWSPVSIDGGEGIRVLGQEHFSLNTILKISPSKSTEKSCNKVENFFIKKGDFFVSRGNTVDLVGLASIVEGHIEDDIIFPDLYIKINFDESKVDKEYLAFLFNSFFGRLYFKYVAKGKNQTMVKVSAAELLNFRVPIPERKKQADIVECIKIQLEEQKDIDRKIEEKQRDIDQIIEDAIRMSA